MIKSKSNKLKVCLINAPVLGVLEPWYDTPDFGRTALAYLAGYLRQFEVFSIQIIDAKLERLNFTQVLDRVRTNTPHIIGFTAFTNEIKPAAYQAAIIKREFPDIVTVIGGVHVTSLPEETLLEFKSFDIGVIGEGEEIFYKLCSALKNNTDIQQIPGLVFRKDDKISKTKPAERILDQDTIPLPAWDLLPRSKTYFVQSARGCPLNCIFCMNPNGRVARKRSVKNVIEELNWIISEFNPERISFGDELFSVDMPRAKDLLEAMAENNIGDKVSWDVQTHVQYVDDELFLKFKKAKVERVELGIETGDEITMKKMGKGTSLEKIMKACNAAKSAGVKIGTFFLFGQPDETITTLQKTVDLAVKINPDLPMFGLMTPYPGTEVAKMAAKGEGGYKLLSFDWDEYNKQIGGAMEFANLSRAQIEWFQVKAYLKVYLYNHRYLDLVKFIYAYRNAAWEVLKKIILRRKSLVVRFNKPIDYDASLYSQNILSLNTFITSRENWKTVQQTEMKRAKLAAK